jgi:hypothetical protein
MTGIPARSSKVIKQTSVNVMLLKAQIRSAWQIEPRTNVLQPQESYCNAHELLSVFYAFIEMPTQISIGTSTTALSMVRNDTNHARIDCRNCFGCFFYRLLLYRPRKNESRIKLSPPADRYL